MSDFDEIGELESEVDRLDAAMGEARAMTAAFGAELRGAQAAMGGTLRDLGALERGFSGGLRRAFEGVALEGRTLSEALRGLGRSMADTVLDAAVRPVTDHLGGLLGRGVGALLGGVVPNSEGAAFSQGRVRAFARGGVVSQPTTFPMRGATGLMGEAGPEAILPLERDASGRLGVSASGRGPVSVTINVRTPDVEGFRRSRSQIAAEVGRAIGQGARNR